MHPNGAILNEILRKENVFLNQGWNLTNEQYIEWSTSIYKCDSQGFEEDTYIYIYIYRMYIYIYIYRMRRYSNTTLR